MKTANSKLPVFVCGMPGSGKSVAVEYIAGRFRIGCVHTSGILKELMFKQVSEINPFAVKMGTGFWESKEGLAYLEKRQTNHSFDKKLDAELIRIARRGSVSMDSWTMPWIYRGNAIRIWLEAPLESRAKRISLRDKKKYSGTIAKIRKRDTENRKLYKKLYGFDLGNDLKPFDLVVNTAELDQGQVRKILGDYVSLRLKK